MKTGLQGPLHAFADVDGVGVGDGGDVPVRGLVRVHEGINGALVIGLQLAMAELNFIND